MDAPCRAGLRGANGRAWKGRQPRVSRRQISNRVRILTDEHVNWSNSIEILAPVTKTYACMRKWMQQEEGARGRASTRANKEGAGEAPLVERTAVKLKGDDKRRII